MKATRKSPGNPCSSLMNCQQHRCAPKPDCSCLSPVLSRKQVCLCVLAIVVSVLPLSAQKIRYSPSFGAAGNPAVSVVHNASFGTNPTADEERCFPWNASEIRTTTVSVTRLKIPPKARREYEQACDASNQNKLEVAEQHARSAIDKFKDYAAAWVMLGVVLEGQHKAPEARDACSQAAAIDAAYLPAYLCAAEFSARNRATAANCSTCCMVPLP